ncbi:PepSY domain-containing protein [Siphonobacter sp. SORGH_AS_1065]|uniref:PepSY-associated TM helix domain-containing protein n=1 Tax=Siphonobacter sp. SORGH_AS_1065 TaxID=3041795 RepID=UPI0027886EA6|nr:PepSY-associated TM helix domain-containing protein [Siphonobacter sp. SORGH_AS_1065]MDQ1089999.1 putative iron-regulated membrane protein [Siphonobacter sp. SORGH_AS_1065]
MSKKYTFRKVVNDLHLWVGLPCTLVLFIMCLTGTMYVFNREITQWVDQDKFQVSAPAQAQVLPISQLISIVEKEKKDSRVSVIQIPENTNEAWTFGFLPKGKKGEGKEPAGVKAEKGKQGKAPKKEKPKNFWVNPYTGAIQGDAQTPTVKFFASTLQLHRWLMIENHDIGGLITGIACFGMLFLCISGFILWLPAKISSWKKWKVWKTGLVIKTDASGKRLNFDLHKTLGFYAFVFVTIMALTGPIFAYEWYRDGYRNLFGFKAIEENTEVAVTGNAIVFEKLIAEANRVYPYTGALRINIPKKAEGTVSIQKNHSGFFASAGTDRIVFNPYSGQALLIDRFSEKPFGQKMTSLTKAIHTGEIFGTFTKILYFLACLIATSLPITGFFIWWNRGKSDKGKAKTKVAATPSIPIPARAVRRSPVMQTSAKS